jgi:hypothetical protein
MRYPRRRGIRRRGIPPTRYQRTRLRNLSVTGGLAAEWDCPPARYPGEVSRRGIPARYPDEVSENSSRAGERGCPPARYLLATRYPPRCRVARYPGGEVSGGEVSENSSRPARPRGRRCIRGRRGIPTRYPRRGIRRGIRELV